jgi:hypothetical protein
MFLRMKEGNDKLTISVNKEIKDKFKEFCDEEGLKIGKRLEKFMAKELKDAGIDFGGEDGKK